MKLLSSLILCLSFVAVEVYGHRDDLCQGLDNEISGTYVIGDKIDVEIPPAPHAKKGFFLWFLCNVDEQRLSQDCLENNQLSLVNGKSYLSYDSKHIGPYEVALRVPNITCKHCVIQTTFVTEGDQGKDVFYQSCANIEIVPLSDVIRVKN